MVQTYDTRSPSGQTSCVMTGSQRTVRCTVDVHADV